MFNASGWSVNKNQSKISKSLLRYDNCEMEMGGNVI